MTFSINATVVSIEPPDPGRSGAQLLAVASDVVTIFEREVPAIYSNTEGKILRASIDLIFDGDGSPLTVGQVVTLTGSFTAKPSTG